MKAETIILGNVITMDEFKPYAEAIAVADEKIIYVGSRDAAMKLKDDKTRVLDYGKNSVYPGFLEAHCHPGFAGNNMLGRANLKTGKTPEDYLAILKKYVDENQDKPHIVGSGWTDDLLYQLNAKQLDEICPDKPMINQSASGHMMWINTKAMEAYDINEEASYHIISSLKDIKEHPNTPLYNVGNNLRNILIQSNIEKQDVEKMSNDVLLYIFLTVKGLLWDVISMNKGLPREKVKTTMFQQVFYSNSGYAYRWKEWAVEFETMFPNVYSIIGRWKEKLRPKEVEEYISKYNIRPNKPTAALSIAMQNLESRIMSTILKRMYERKWYAINLHDCIIVPKTGDSTESPSIDQLKHLMDDVYKQFGLAATFR